VPLPPLTGFEQASLEIEGGDTIDCWFNPKEYTIAKANQWEVKPVTGVALPTAQYGGGQPRKLSLQLLFDSTDSDSLDVSDVTAKLFKMMEAQASLGSGKGKNSGRPPMVTFVWGSTVTFKAVADNLSVQYTLFRADGTPVRAQAQLSLIQADKAMDKSSGKGKSKPQNPTTRAQPGLGSHTVRDGDSLASIAFAHYRDPTRWRAIAEANGIDDPLRLKRGTVLSIPSIE
jgi:nucleoid-associated protein YgaU